MLGQIISSWMTNAANRREAEKSRDFEMEMWNQQNAYNSPQAQMERYKEAGLNPNLIYGQGTPGNATEMPKYNAPRMSWDIALPTIMQTLDSYWDIKVKQQQEQTGHQQAVSQNLANKWERIRQAALLETEEAKRLLPADIYTSLRASVLKDTSELGKSQAQAKTAFEEARIREIERKFMEGTGMKGLSSIFPVLIRGLISGALK